MKICVVTPYFRTETAWLQQAHDSVKAQSVPAAHIVVCDGSEPAQIGEFQGVHIILQRNYQDYGNTPRLIGSYRAVTAEADAIAYLDADNWYEPAHLEGLVRFAQERNLDACSSARMLHRLDGTPMMKCPHVTGQPYIDTSCMLVMKSAFSHLIAWTCTLRRSPPTPTTACGPISGWRGRGWISSITRRWHTAPAITCTMPWLASRRRPRRSIGPTCGAISTSDQPDRAAITCSGMSKLA